MSVTKHITQIGTTEANLLANLDDHQWGIATDTKKGFFREGSLKYQMAVERSWNGSAWAYVDAVHGNIEAKGYLQTAQFVRKNSSNYIDFGGGGGTTNRFKAVVSGWEAILFSITDNKGLFRINNNSLRISTLIKGQYGMICLESGASSDTLKFDKFSENHFRNQISNDEYEALRLVNYDDTATGETGQAVSLAFWLKANIDSSTFEAIAAKIIAGKDADWFDSGSPVTDIKSNLQFWITSANVLAEAARFHSDKKLQCKGALQVDGSVVNLNSLPTSASGLASGDIWNNSNVINIV
ncbi:MAG: hypothetical protein U9Q21_02565 [Candidatus Auribacterota bacterium]|nr:hypothetical protein [Candidatus Auribacterota bacterium]